MSSAGPSRRCRRHIGPKIAATAMNAMPAEAKASIESSVTAQALEPRTRARRRSGSPTGTPSRR